MKKIIFAVIIAAVITGLFLITRKTEVTHEKKITLSEQQIEPYINLKGWKVTKIGCDTIRIPQNFTGPYEVFADEMKRSGFDLEYHKGENVKRYTYSVDNYGQQGIIAELLITNDNELISAAIIQQKTNGFIKSLNR